jgi:hypothetical protein
MGAEDTDIKLQREISIAFRILVRDVSDRAADLMHGALLNLCVWKVSSDRVRKTSQVIDAADQNILGSSIFQLIQNRQPKF